MNAIAANIANIKKHLPPKAQLIAVSKQQPEDRIDMALAAGQRCFGENRVQEAQKRWAARRALYPDLELHLIGPLQSNKVRDAVALFDVIHTIDRPKLADAVCQEIKSQNRNVSCLIQVNTGLEDQKSGVAPADLVSLLDHCRDIGLGIDGLMVIPPVDQPPALHFALLKKLSQENGLPDLSMGMSNDFEKALALGAHYIRIGTGIFGPREPSTDL